MRSIALFLCLLSLAQNVAADPRVKLVVKPKVRLSKNWILIVDTSDSMNGVFHKAMKGFRTVISQPTDEWYFQVWVFNNKGAEKHTKWFEASPKAFKKAEKWADKPANHGVNSYGRAAIAKALRTARKVLSIILITDAGFSSACSNRGFGSIRATIASGQKWRLKEGYAAASITTIGVSNPHYSAWCRKCSNKKSKKDHNFQLPDVYYANKGGKPSNKKCMAFMRKLGTVYKGGFILVRGAILDLPKKKKKHKVTAAGKR